MQQFVVVEEVVVLELIASGRCLQLMLDNQVQIMMSAVLEEGGKESNK